MKKPLSPAYNFTVRLKSPDRSGLEKVTAAIESGAGRLIDIHILEMRRGVLSEARDAVQVQANFHARDEQHAQAMVEKISKIEGVRILEVVDEVLKLHEKGKLEIKSRIQLKTKTELSMAYTPGVARVCQVINEDEDKVFDFTTKANTVAVVTDGTAVLGLGDIGPRAALPVMEGKAILFKEFGGVDAFPICLDTKDEDEIVATVKAIAPGFGGINLEDISAPRCFTIEERLKRELDIPVFHDDQHGTAVVVLAAMMNALEVVGKKMPDIKVVISGVGAAGVAVTNILLAAGVGNIIGCDRAGAIYRGRREHMSPVKEEYARQTNPALEKGSIAAVLKGADVFIGVSAPGIVTPDDIKKMTAQAIVFALANPVPEVMPEDIASYVAVTATGRSDYPNQINNVLCFPGIFRGALDCRAKDINEEMKLAAAQAIAGAVKKDELGPEYIIPSVFDPEVAGKVAEAAIIAARKTGVARKK